MKDIPVLPFILQLAGVLVIIAEIIIPSGGLLSLLAAGVIGYSLYIMFTEVSSHAAFYLGMADVALIPLLVYYGLKLLEISPVTLKDKLSKDSGVVSQAQALTELMDKEGEALTDLRPSGTAQISGKRVDVVTRGEYVEKGESIKVISVTGNQVIVRKNTKQP